MLTPEEIFLRDLKAFLHTEYELNDVVVNKIKYLLDAFKGSVKKDIQIIERNFCVYRINASTQISPETKRKLLGYNDLQKEFDEFCKKRNIKYVNEKKQGRSTKETTKLRADFCNYVAENYLVSKSELAVFFNLNHATIHYYFNPKCKKK